MVRALHNCSEEFEGTNIGVVHYTTIASAVQHAARHLEKMRQSNTEIAIELENTLDVWSEHNDAVEARSLRQSLVQCIYQQNMSESDANMLKEKLASFMQRQFGDFENLHRDPTKPFMQQNSAAGEADAEWTDAEAKYYESCEKTGMIPTDGQRVAAVKLYLQFKTDAANGSITVISGVAGSGKSSVYKLVVHMLNGDADKFVGMPPGVGGEYDGRDVFAEHLSEDAKQAEGKDPDAAHSAAVKVQKRVRDWLRHRALGATTIFSDKFSKAQNKVAFHLEVIRSGSLDMESLIGCNQNGTWWDGLLLRRLRQINEIASEKQTRGIPWKALVVLDGSSGALVEQFSSSPFHKSQRSIAQDMMALPPNVDFLMENTLLENATPASLGSVSIVHIAVEDEDVAQTLMMSWIERISLENTVSPLVVDLLERLLILGGIGIPVNDDGSVEEMSENRLRRKSSNVAVATTMSRVKTMLAILETMLHTFQLLDAGVVPSRRQGSGTEQAPLAEETDIISLKACPCLGLFSETKFGILTLLQANMLNRTYLCFVFAYSWGFGGHLQSFASRKVFTELLRQVMVKLRPFLTP